MVKAIHATKPAPQQGEIIWLDFDPQSGQEQAGHRPAVVMSQTAYNQRTGRAFVCPITSKVKGYPFEVAISVGSVAGAALADHMKNADWRSRETRRTGQFVDEETLESLWQLVNSLH
jgi:mRNA interferase MazF